MPVPVRRIQRALTASGRSRPASGVPHPSQPVRHTGIGCMSGPVRWTHRVAILATPPDETRSASLARPAGPVLRPDGADPPATSRPSGGRHRGLVS